MIENRKYWMIPKNIVGTIIVLFMLIALGGLIYMIFETPRQMRIGVYPKINELEQRIDDAEKELKYIKRFYVKKPSNNHWWKRYLSWHHPHKQIIPILAK